MPSHNELKAALSNYPSALRLKADSTKSSQDLVELDKWYRGELRETMAKRREEHERDEAFFTVEEVGKLMKWKLARGKWRPRLEQLALNNPDSTVRTATSTASAASLPRLSALKELSTLKGLGPATASAILALWYPDSEAFMSDEAMENVEAYGEGEAGKGKRDYTVKAWREFGEKMRVRKEKEGWESMEDLEKALWSWAIHRKLGGKEEIEEEEPVKKKVSKKRSSDVADLPATKKSKST